jgi:single-stranded-DNA-specific exonuclease
LITVDCGIINHEVEYLQQQGVDVILTDHHTPPPNLPRAFALLNPKVSSEKNPFVDFGRRRRRF